MELVLLAINNSQGWSSQDHKGQDNKNTNGLIRGCGDYYQPHNIFVLSNLQYMSNSNSYLINDNRQ